MFTISLLWIVFLLTIRPSRVVYFAVPILTIAVISVALLLNRLNFAHNLIILTFLIFLYSLLFDIWHEKA